LKAQTTLEFIQTNTFLSHSHKSDGQKPAAQFAAHQSSVTTAEMAWHAPGLGDGDGLGVGSGVGRGGDGPGDGGAGGGFTLPALTASSMPHSLLPRAMRKNPLSPHSSFHEFLIFQ